jgi:hypothetical protein
MSQTLSDAQLSTVHPVAGAGVHQCFLLGSGTYTFTSSAAVFEEFYVDTASIESGDSISAIDGSGAATLEYSPPSDDDYGDMGAPAIPYAVLGRTLGGMSTIEVNVAGGRSIRVLDVAIGFPAPLPTTLRLPEVR